jgi:two-component system response regulator AtoC
MARLLVVDDDPSIRGSLAMGLSESGHEIETVANATDALRAATDAHFDVVLLDLGLPDRNGLEVLAELRRVGHHAPIVVISGDTDMASTVRAMRDGAFDFLSKPFDPEDLDDRINRALHVAAKKIAVTRTSPPLDEESGIDLVGNSETMRELFKMLGLLSASRATVLIRGESGTGKELAARVLHEFSPKAHFPFVAVNCAALPGPLVEAEIFGYRRGAFTGADQDRAGKLEAAADGTLFLDEVGEVPLETQVKLLRVLQERQYERLGETESRPFRARIVAATHRDLESLVRSGAFREDLYYRLNVATVTLPPLRERREDLPLIAERLLVQISKEVGHPVSGIAPSALARLQSHDWQGNVRELRNVLTRAAILCRGDTIVEENIEFGTRADRDLAKAFPVRAPGRDDSDRIPTLAEAECELIRRALARARGHRAKTCRLLGISRPTLLRKIRRYGLE